MKMKNKLKVKLKAIKKMVSSKLISQNKTHLQNLTNKIKIKVSLI